MPTWCMSSRKTATVPYRSNNSIPFESFLLRLILSKVKIRNSSLASISHFIVSEALHPIYLILFVASVPLTPSISISLADALGTHYSMCVRSTDNALVGPNRNSFYFIFVRIHFPHLNLYEYLNEWKLRWQSNGFASDPNASMYQLRPLALWWPQCDEFLPTISTIEWKPNLIETHSSING